MERRFTRLRPGDGPKEPGFYEVPTDGMCLSTFLILERPGRPNEVLLGRLDPSAPWLELGALEGPRVATIGTRWMLPSSHLLFFEAPEEAARRIVREQLETELDELPAPLVVSEAHRRPNSSAADPHWDLGFIFRTPWPRPEPPRARAWKELAFVDVRSLPRGEIARAQGDILELAGLPPKD